MAIEDSFKRGKSLLHEQRWQRERKRVGKDLEQWMFMILRTGSSVGFAAGDCDISVGFAAVYRDNRLALENREQTASGPHQGS